MPRRSWPRPRPAGRIVGVCHVLRYTPYFRELKDILDSGLIGEVISVQHMEPIEHIAHEPLLRARRLAQQQDDHAHHPGQELPRHRHHSLAGGRPRRRNVHCFGNLKWFKQANAPHGSTERCTDGCAVERECPYSALQIYYRDRKRLYVFDLPEDSDSGMP